MGRRELLIKQLKEFQEEHRDLDAILIQLQEKQTIDFVQIKRLKKRAQDPDHIVKQRLSFYKMELSHWREYKYVLINKNLTETVKKIKSILEAERIINQKQTLILKKVRSL